MKLEQKIQAEVDTYLILFGYYHYVEKFLWWIRFKVRVTVTALLVRVTPCLLNELDNMFWDWASDNWQKTPFG